MEAPPYTAKVRITSPQPQARPFYSNLRQRRGTHLGTHRGQWGKGHHQRPSHANHSSFVLPPLAFVGGSPAIAMPPAHQQPQYTPAQPPLVRPLGAVPNPGYAATAPPLHQQPMYKTASLDTPRTWFLVHVFAPATPTLSPRPRRSTVLRDVIWTPGALARPPSQCVPDCPQ